VVSPALIAIDWGTSTARAYRLDDRGAVLHANSAPLGVQKVAAGGFPAALAMLLEGVDGDVPMIACGMIGSRQGWIEAPYRDCPADLAGLASALTRVPGTRLSIVPGLLCRDETGTPDVMRGEETQILGALDELDETGDEPRLIVLPGTHSKWALVRASGIDTFATFLTGELYAVLREHSILGRLAAPGDDSIALERGVRRSLEAGASLSHDLFSARTLALTAELAPDAVGDYLSGLLLGAELAAGRRWLERQRVMGETVHLIGDTALCERYRHAFALAGFDAVAGPVDAAARGLWRLARRANMVSA
jgi:2-dehydro-3-deoxygalactonokinase